MLKHVKNPDYILILIILLAAVLNIFNIWTDDYANPYYTAAVNSMMQSFENFFFASFDAAGYVTVDKPPVAFWVQTISAFIFGYDGWSVILPQALAGIGSVILMYVLIKPSFGTTAARIASLVMACTPIAAAVSRTNNIDSLLVFTLLLATWVLFKAVKNEKALWLIGSFAVIGIGFNMKMLQAFMVLPAFYLFYLLATKIDWKRKAKVLSGATVVLLVVSLSWAVIVEFTPEENRPYVGSSQTNSVLELAFGYNGISRLIGLQKGGSDAVSIEERNGTPQQMSPNRSRGGIPGGGPPNGQMTPEMEERMKEMQEQMESGESIQSGNNPMMGGARQMDDTGEPGLLRLFSTALSDQISWFIPFILIASIGLLMKMRTLRNITRENSQILFWLLWFIPIAAFFSVASFFHSYYLVMLAPPIAALTGIGWMELVKSYLNHNGWQKWLLPIAILVTTLFELYILMANVIEIGFGLPLVVAFLGIGLSLALFIMKKNNKFSYLTSIASLLVLLIAPFYWSTTPMLYGGMAMLPAAGPDIKNTQGMAQMMIGEADPKTIEYLTENNTGEEFLFATAKATTAAPYIIETGEAVMAMGGFSGTDSILTVEQLSDMVKEGKVKYFILTSELMGRGSGVEDWIKEHGTEIPNDQWQSTSNESQMSGTMTLFKITEVD
ncbi:glycosyltransferase family 39 protein [Cytobacillus sp. IB215316]|uniref:glycosyltransferase family 39 protein n=1 Tax=Cytobacillus sp. IB215316 TaxID=3097354 RepID=UPI002A15D80F|nr:glycosyltransferase family 39 protein [Cytobacillus sp. IB215316]MDX8361747.1 glycosyltransferase family 39 protein [Cytobacillus sp. IB215316]